MSWQYDTEIEDDKLREDIDSIQEDNEEADASNLTWKDLFSNSDRSMNLWRFSAACGAQAMQQVRPHFVDRYDHKANGEAFWNQSRDILLNCGL